METLFTTELQGDTQRLSYHVSFYEDAYHFNPADASAESFTIKREHDEWHVVNGIENNTTRSAIVALDAYLLSQH